MSIVDRMSHLSAVGNIIVCPEMKLLAGDHEPPVVVALKVIHMMADYASASM